MEQLVETIGKRTIQKEQEIEGLKERLERIGTEVSRKKELEHAIAKKDHTLKSYQLQMQELESQKESLQAQVRGLRSELKDYAVEVPANYKQEIAQLQRQVDDNHLSLSLSLLYTICLTDMSISVSR